MDREINLDSILALEKQIEGHEGHEETIIQLKRTRNSLLNISTLLPPEILGSIFHWNVIPEREFGGLPNGSYNFLLVCHHWFEVASRTPELWSSWGNSIRDWERRYARCGTAPLDLALDWAVPSDQLLDALRDRAAQGTIRQVHLRNTQTSLLESVLSAIVTQGEGEEIRSSSVESFKAVTYGPRFVDISAFFSRCHLSQLRSLLLYGCRISSWGLLNSQTAALTTLKLTTDQLSPVPTLSQLLSILSSSPLLRDLLLRHNPGSYVAGRDAPTIRVQLRHLERLRLSGDFHCFFALLSWLELPGKMDTLHPSLYWCPPSSLSQALGPYFGDRVRRRGGIPGGGIGLLAQYNNSTFWLRAGDTRIGDDPANVVWFVEISAATSTPLEDKEVDRLCFELIAHIQWEQVTSLKTNFPILRWEELCVEMHNLTHLYLVEIDLSTWFTELVAYRLHASQELLRSLDRIVITKPTLGGGDWSPLTNFLSSRAAVGKRISSLKLSGHPHMDEDVVRSIKRVVDVFENEGGDGDVTTSG